MNLLFGKLLTWRFMSVLHYSEMPMSFTGRAMLWGASSSIFNLPLSKKGCCNSVIHNVLQPLARIVYQLAAIVLFPLGMAYHLTMATARKLQSWVWCNADTKVRAKALAWEHLKAAGYDGAYFFAIFASIFASESQRARNTTKIFVIDPEQTVKQGMSSTLVKATPLSDIEEVVVEEVCKKKNGLEHYAHKSNIERMKTGLYHFDELVYQGLVLRHNDKVKPLASRICQSIPLDDFQIRISCAGASYEGTYAR